MSKSTTVFVRQATGLVKNISPYQLIFFNFLTAPVINTFMYSMNWDPNFFPGFNFNTGLLVISLLVVPMYLTYAIVYSAFPKTGTDYVFQSRVLTPSIGFAATFASWVFFQFWFIALNGVTSIQMFLNPWLYNLAAITGNQGYASLGDTLSSPMWVGVLSFAYVIIAGLIVLGGMRIFLRAQTVLFVCAGAAIIAFMIMLGMTSSGTFAANLNAQLSGPIGSSNAIGTILSTAQSKGYVPIPPSNLYLSVGAMVTPWTFALEWTLFGNLGLGGETKSAGKVKTQVLTMLGAYALVVIGLFVLWELFAHTVGQTFWTAISSLAFNVDPLLSKLPTLFLTQPASFVFLYGTHNLVLSSIWAIGGALGTVATTFTIYVLVTRMVFAQTFDRLFPSKLAYITERTQTPIYIMISMIAVALAWTYGFLYAGPTFYTYLASTQFMISVTMILTMVGAIIFPWRLKQLFDQSLAKRYRGVIIPLALVGILVNLLVMYYLWTVPAFLARTTQSEALLFGVFIIAIIYYFVIKAYHARSGINLKQAFQEIPPD